MGLGSGDSLDFHRYKTGLQFPLFDQAQCSSGPLDTVQHLGRESCGILNHLLNILRVDEIDDLGNC